MSLGISDDEVAGGDGEAIDQTLDSTEIADDVPAKTGGTVNQRNLGQTVDNSGGAPADDPGTVRERSVNRTVDSTDSSVLGPATPQSRQMQETYDSAEVASKVQVP